MTNEQNVPVWQWPYSAFGNNKPTGILKATPNPRAAMTNNPVLLRATGATELNLRFPGQYADEEAGQFYNYFRNYQPNQGRYTQNDPIGLAGGLNRFAYVEGNPLMFTDPLGLSKSTGSPTLDRWLAPKMPPGNCATAECAAGLSPTPSDNRSQKQMDFGQCKMVCQISISAPVAMCNAVLCGGLAGTVAGAVGKGGLCTGVCK